MSERKFIDAYNSHLATKPAWFPSYQISVVGPQALPAEHLVSLIESARGEALRPFYELLGKDFVEENLTFDFSRISSVNVAADGGDLQEVTVKVHPVGAPNKAVEVTVEFFFEEGRQGPPDATVQGVKIFEQYPILGSASTSMPMSSELFAIERLLKWWDQPTR